MVSQTDKRGKALSYYWEEELPSCINTSLRRHPFAEELNWSFWNSLNLQDMSLGIIVFVVILNPLEKDGEFVKLLATLHSMCPSEIILNRVLRGRGALNLVSIDSSLPFCCQERTKLSHSFRYSTEDCLLGALEGGPTCTWLSKDRLVILLLS